MIQIKAGPGIRIIKNMLYGSYGEQIEMTIELDTQIEELSAQYALFDDERNGKVLMINEYGHPVWRKPFESDKELRERYPVLEQAWSTLMEALAEYELTKKLVTDEDDE